MKFLITLLTLVCIVSADTTSKYENATLTSDVKNFTVTSTVAGKQGTETMKVGYYVKKLTEKSSGKSVYQLHGNCYLNNLDVTGYTTSKQRVTSCIIGIYGTVGKNGPDQTLTIVDAMVLGATWSVAKPAATTWKCTDKFQSDGGPLKYTTDTGTDPNNCMANAAQSKLTVADKKVNMNYHFHRDFFAPQTKAKTDLDL